jgi:transposase
MNGRYIQVDETPIKYLYPGNGKCAQGYLWVVGQPGGDVVFDWHTTRAATCLQKLVPIDFNGTLQCDGFTAYDRFASLRSCRRNSRLRHRGVSRTEKKTSGLALT